VASVNNVFSQSYSLSRNSRKQPPLSVEEHAAVAAELFSIRARLYAMLETFNKFGSSDVSSRYYVKLLAALDGLRSVLDDRAARDHRAEYTPRLYYPGAATPYVANTKAAVL